MTKTILSALALAVAISFASCSNKKACNNKQDAAATQANDTANAASNNQEQADGSTKYTDFTLPTLDGKRVLLSEDNDGRFLGFVVRSLPYGDA